MQTFSVTVQSTRAVAHYAATTDPEPASVAAVPYELRAEVSFSGPHDEPSVVWLDAAVLADLDLSDAELEGAEEMAVELAVAKLQSAEGRREVAAEEQDRAEFLAEVGKDVA